MADNKHKDRPVYSANDEEARLDIIEINQKILDQNINYTCIVHALGTGAPHETVDPLLTEFVSINTNIQLTNPFGINTPLICKIELLQSDGYWTTPNCFHVATVGEDYGISVSAVQDLGIFLTSSRHYLTGSLPQRGINGTWSVDRVQSAEVRIHCWRCAV